MRIASLDEVGASSSARRALSPGRVEIDKTKKAKEIVRALVGSFTEEEDIVVACDSKSKLWKDVDLKRAMQNWNMKYVDMARSPESASRVFASSERLANQMRISEFEEVGKLVKKSETGDMNVGKVGRSARCDQEECMKPEQDAMLAAAGEENEFIKCFDDITGKELPWQAVMEAREKELTYLRELGVYEKVDYRAAVAKCNITPVDTKWVDTDKAFGEGATAKSVHGLLSESSEVGTDQTCV